MRSRLLRPVLIMVSTLLAGAAALLVTALPAEAHNVLRSTSPADGREVTQTPGEVVLTFDEPAIAMGTQILVTGPDGPVQDGTARLVDNTVAQTLRPGSPAGRYTVSWRVTSADGHPITGQFSFDSRAASSAGPSGSAEPTQSAAPAPISPQSGPPGFVWVGIVVVLVALGVLGWRIARRRGGGQTAREGDRDTDRSGADRPPTE